MQSLSLQIFSQPRKRLWRVTWASIWTNTWMSGTSNTAGLFQFWAKTKALWRPTLEVASCRDTGKYCDQIKEFQTEPIPSTTPEPKFIPMKPKDVIVGKPLNRQPPSQPHHIGNTHEGHPSGQKGYSPQMPGDFPTSVPFFKNPTASSFPSAVRAPSTPYPYYQRNPQDEYNYKRPTHFKKPSQSFTESPFQDHFDPIIKNKKPLKSIILDNSLK